MFLKSILWLKTVWSICFLHLWLFPESGSRLILGQLFFTTEVRFSEILSPVLWIRSFSVWLVSISITGPIWEPCHHFFFLSFGWFFPKPQLVSSHVCVFYWELEEKTPEDLWGILWTSSSQVIWCMNSSYLLLSDYQSVYPLQEVCWAPFQFSFPELWLRNS